MKIKKITFLVKQVRYQKVEVSEEAGFDSIDTPLDLIDRVETIKNDPAYYCLDEEWENGEFVTSDLDIVEKGSDDE